MTRQEAARYIALCATLGLAFAFSGLSVTAGLNHVVMWWTGATAAMLKGGLLP